MIKTKEKLRFKRQKMLAATPRHCKSICGWSSPPKFIH